MIPTEIVLHDKPDTSNVIDGNQKQKLANKKRRGEEKPFKDCKECLYILHNCKACEDADMFFDRENVMQDEIRDVLTEAGNIPTESKAPITTRTNRVTTQFRDGCNF